jgi:hypothetical protein
MFTTVRDKATWDWTMLSMLPDWISPQIYERAVDAVRRKADSPALSKLRAAAYHEGLVAQILHVGAYDDEGPVLERLHGTWLAEHGYVENGKHHEIYLSDPRRVAPEMLRTVLRQPIRKRCARRQALVQPGSRATSDCPRTSSPARPSASPARRPVA